MSIGSFENLLIIRITIERHEFAKKMLLVAMVVIVSNICMHIDILDRLCITTVLKNSKSNILT
jgi:hypothetical protein